MLDVDHELQALTLRGRHQVPPRVSLPPSLPDYDPNSCFLTQSLPGFLRSILCTLLSGDSFSWLTGAKSGHIISFNTFWSEWIQSVLSGDKEKGRFASVRVLRTYKFIIK